MFHRPFNLALGLSVFALTSVANAGGWSGNGSDLLQEQDNAWFIGDETVEYCIERDATFPVELPSLQRLVKDGLSDWAAFFTKYSLDRTSLGQPGTLGGRFPDGKLRGLSLTFKEVEHCSVLKKQISFLFGTTTPEIEAFRAAKGDALSFAIRSEYDHKSYRNGGFIWIPGIEAKKPLNWAEHPMLLKHLLLHELGHVFGMRHDSVFVMSSTVSSEVLQGLNYSLAIDETIYGQIDHPTWPYRLQEGVTLNLTYDLGGAMGIPRGYRPNSAIPEEVRRALGLQADGWHSLRISYRAEPAA